MGPLLAPLLLQACSWGEPAPQTQLRPATDLTRDCFHGTWTRKDHAKVGTPFVAGDKAIDFTLRTPGGKPVNLSDLLADKPVVLHAGSATCDVYQSREPDIVAFGAEFADRVHTVVVYTVEAHPKTDPSPYKGVPKPRDFSDRNQSRDWDERARSAAGLELGADVTVLVDDLGGDTSNPFWCTYGQCPNCSFLIRQDGVFEAVHLWHDPKTMRASTLALLKRMATE